ncbi:MAG TPA: zf-HC2 domain-containing protein [Lacisediminihabitans sp.]|uniref:anti-sigma factor family protein n=1 Tax=Lacisediminihabitans sp. TaxID=2787631 RepID=UPI002EDA5853
MSGIDRYADWDAAYVLGSLSEEERLEYEAHLATCDSCSAAVAELAGVPALLGRLPSADAESLLGAVPEPPVVVPPMPATLLPRIARSVRRRRRRARAFVAGGLVAAAAVAASIALVFPLVIGGAHPAGGTELALARVVPSSLSASVRLEPTDWGTRIEMTCRYRSGGPSYGSGEYAMVVTDTAGHSSRVATWTAEPGSTVQPTGTTSLAASRIASIDVRRVSDGEVLLSGSP